MRVLGVLPVLALAGVWAVAIAAWPDLPPRFPSHFDLSGRPDAWWDTTATRWFLLPALASVIVLAFGSALPVWLRGLARADSPHLNVPYREQFSRLAPDARVAALGPMIVALRIVSVEIALLFGAIVHGSAEVAAGTRERLSGTLEWTALVLIVATGVASALAGRRAIQRAIAAGISA